MNSKAPSVSSGSPLLERSLGWFRTAALVALVLLLSRYVYLRTLAGTGANDDSAEPLGPWPGLRQPAVMAMEDVNLPDNAPIIGIEVAGRARAYLLRAMSLKPERHVINDLLGDRPISVTYCDRTNCARVFTSADKGAALNLDVGGWIGDSLAVQINGINYEQKTGKNLTTPGGAPLPYADCPFVQTTWGAWRSVHPQSDVFVGS